MRILNDTQSIPEWVLDCRDLDALPNVLNLLKQLRPELQKAIDRGLRVMHAP